MSVPPGRAKSCGERLARCNAGQSAASSAHCRGLRSCVDAAHHPAALVRANVRTLKKRQTIGVAKTLLAWIGMGYERATVVEAPGSFLRARILDIFPPASPYPIRIELFGEEIESLRKFDPGLQRSQDALDEAIITPASEALARHGQQAIERIGQWDLGTCRRIWPRRSSAISPLAQRRSFQRHRALPALFLRRDRQPDQLFGRRGLVVLDEPGEMADVWSELEEQPFNCATNPPRRAHSAELSCALCDLGRVE